LANHQVTVESPSSLLSRPALMGAPVLTLARIRESTSWLEPSHAPRVCHFQGCAVRACRILRPRATARRCPESSGNVSRDGVERSQRDGSRRGSHGAQLSYRRCASSRARFSTWPSNWGGRLFLCASWAACRWLPFPARFDFPVGMGQQDIHIGVPIAPTILRPLNYRDRRHRVIDAINNLVRPTTWKSTAPTTRLCGCSACLVREHERQPGPCRLVSHPGTASQHLPEIAALVAGARAGELRVSSTPEGRWLAELARRLLGPRGPGVVGVHRPNNWSAAGARRRLAGQAKVSVSRLAVHSRQADGEASVLA